MAIKQNIVIDQGTNFSVQFDITDEGLNPISYANSTVTSQLRKHYLSSNSVSFICNAYSNGTIILTISANSTVNLTAGRYVYDVFANNERLVEGIATITPQVTK